MTKRISFPVRQVMFVAMLALACAGLVALLRFWEGTGVAQSNLTDKSTYNLIRDGDLKVFRIGKRRGIRVSESELEKWESGENNAGITETGLPSIGETEFQLPTTAMKALTNPGA